jgi:hypothetical protein
MMFLKGFEKEKDKKRKLTSLTFRPSGPAAR